MKSVEQAAGLPAGRRVASQWHCIACTYINSSPQVVACEMCGTPKPKDAAALPSLARQPSSLAAQQFVGHDRALTSKIGEAIRAAEGTPSLPVTLNYTRDQGETLYHSVDPNDKRITTHQREIAQKAHVSVDTDLYNARKVKKPLKLFEAGFELCLHKTTLKENQFTPATGLTAKDLQAYKKEQETLVQKLSGAARVVAFHTNVRNADPADKNKEKPAYSVHCDYATKSAVKIFDGIASGDVRKSGRFIIVNTWRSVDDMNPIMDDPLACADARSIIGPDDYVSKITYIGDQKVYNYGLDPARRQYHKWYYFPRMVMDEVLVFIQYDSDPLSLARYCFHSAVRDPVLPGTAKQDKIPFRKSIETRLIAFFPDHKPSTIPSFVLSENELVEAVCEKLLEGLGYPQAWPKNGQDWMKTNLSSKGRGASYLITHLVRGGVERKEHGLENSTEQQRNRIIEKLVSDGQWKKKAMANFL